MNVLFSFPLSFSVPLSSSSFSLFLFFASLFFSQDRRRGSRFYIEPRLNWVPVRAVIRLSLYNHPRVGQADTSHAKGGERLITFYSLPSRTDQFGRKGRCLPDKRRQASLEKRSRPVEQSTNLAGDPQYRQTILSSQIDKTSILSLSLSLRSCAFTLFLRRLLS